MPYSNLLVKNDLPFFLITNLITNEPSLAMKKSFFKALAQINKVIIPRYSKRDFTKLSKVDQALVAYRYWVTTNSLD